MKKNGKLKRIKSFNIVSEFYIMVKTCYEWLHYFSVL